MKHSKAHSPSMDLCRGIFLDGITSTIHLYDRQSWLLFLEDATKKVKVVSQCEVMHQREVRAMLHSSL